MRKVLLFLLTFTLMASLAYGGDCPNERPGCSDWVGDLNMTEGDLTITGDATITGDGVITGSLDVSNELVLETKTINADADNVDVSGVNIIFLDTTNNSVTVGGLSNGVAGQVVELIKFNSANSATLENNEGTADEKVYLVDNRDETLNTYGGWKLTYISGVWIEIGDKQTNDLADGALLVSDGVSGFTVGELSYDESTNILTIGDGGISEPQGTTGKTKCWMEKSAHSGTNTVCIDVGDVDFSSNLTITPTNVGISFPMRALQKYTYSAISTGNQTLTAAQLVGGILYHDNDTVAAGTLTFPTATQLRTYIRDGEDDACVDGIGFEFTVVNTGTVGSTLAAPDGSIVLFTDAGANSCSYTPSLGASQKFTAVFTSCSTPTVTVYCTGSEGTH